MRVPTLEAKWKKLARANNYRCRGCGMVPPRSERGVFFARDLCAWCALAADRDDLARSWERGGESAATTRARQRIRPTKPAG
jgi:hypothetical protein